MLVVCVQLKHVLDQRKAELTASYERLLAHIAAMRKQVCIAHCFCSPLLLFLFVIVICRPHYMSLAAE